MLAPRDLDPRTEVLRTGEILNLDEAQDLVALDKYSPTGLATERIRPDAIATISAGDKNEQGYPQPARDGKIRVHEDNGPAPGLRELLEANHSDRLTIAFPYNNPRAFTQQYFARYSRTMLEVHGDENGLVYTHRTGGTDEKPEFARDEFLPEDPQYEALKATCAVVTSLYFVCAEWTPEGPRVLFPDGVGFYRLRTTSRNTVRSLRACLKMVRDYTGGQIAGIPIELTIIQREVATPTGKRQRLPVWSFRVRPPETVARQVRINLRDAVIEGRLLQLPPPALESEDVALADFRELGDDEPVEIRDLSPRDLALLDGGGRANAEYWNKQWHGAVRGTPLADERARHAFIRDFCRADATLAGIGSLSQFLDLASEAQASALLAAAGRFIDDLSRNAALGRQVGAAAPAAPPSAPIEMPAPEPPPDPFTEPAAPEPPDEPPGDPTEPGDEPVDYGDVMPTEDDREAFSVALAAAQANGVDVAAYETDGRETAAQLREWTAQLRGSIEPPPAPPSEPAPIPPPPTGGKPASAPQIARIERDAGPGLLAELRAQHGQGLERLTSVEASALIDRLKH